MNPRLKDYDATGIAPNGRLYAGDLNLLQDSIPRLSDLTQAMQVGTLSVGEVGLSISRYGAGEAALSGALRVSGLLRALGGIVPPTFTTAARNGIAAGSRPYGMVIVNTNKNILEFNAGTDAVPDWQPLVGVKGANGTVLTVVGGEIAFAAPAPGEMPGVVKDFAGIEANVPAGYLPCDGRILAQAAYPALYLAIGNIWDLFGGQAAPGGGNFRVPKFNGLNRVTKKDMGGQAPVTGGISRVAAATLAAVLGEEYHAMTAAENGPHGHGVNDPWHAHNSFNSIYGTRNELWAFGNTYGDANASAGNFPNGDQHDLEHATMAAQPTGISIQSNGSGSGHENVAPSAIVNTIIKT